VTCLIQGARIDAEVLEREAAAAEASGAAEGSGSVEGPADRVGE
jgi:hypothetical protein